MNSLAFTLHRDYQRRTNVSQENKQQGQDEFDIQEDLRMEEVHYTLSPRYKT